MFNSQPKRVLLAVSLAGVATMSMGEEVRPGPAWTAPDRGAKVAALIPGRRTPKLTPATLFADWTRQQVERWDQVHPPLPPEEAFAKFAATAPTDAELTADFPVHISPFGRLRGVQGAEPAHHLTGKADAVLVSYCPMCGSFSFGLAFDPAKPFGHATTTCCRTDLYADAGDWPADSPLKPNSTVRFLHLDDRWIEVPCTLYRDKDGVEWELFFKTIFDHHRWQEQACNLVKQYGDTFRDTADPLYVHKIAILLDKVADTYYGLPLASGHRLCNGKDGKPLTRAEWEAVPRPAIFAVSYLGPWCKRTPYSSPGWLNMMHEHIWVEPFARVRQHPAFKQVSVKLYGDPEALDRKIMTKIMRELSLMFQSVFSQKLLHNYQEAIYIDLWLLGVLTQDSVLIDFAGPCQELSMYNHTYQDGMNGEGAPNYQAMPGGYYYPVLKDPKGWLQYQPNFLEDNPFYRAASSEMFKSQTVRGLALEWGDQHEHVFAPHFLRDPAQVAENEKRGSRNWAGYGVGVIRVGGPGHRQEMSLGYTRAALHNAQDAMSMECWVDGVPVMRRGGYSAWWTSAHLQWDRPEYQALQKMGYPYEIREADYTGFESWSWAWAHSPLNQNTLTVDEIGTGKGWGDNRGYGECVTFKGGEAAGTPGSRFQVLDVLDHYSWLRVNLAVSNWRRTAIGVEGPDGRPYVLDITRVAGGSRHALYNQAWAERAEAELPPVAGQASDLGQVFFGDKLPAGRPDSRVFSQVHNVQRFTPNAPTYGVTWKQDYGAWGNRDTSGKAYQRPVPEDVGKVRLRFMALDQGDRQTELLSGKGPWIGWLRQPLPNHQQVNGCVAFTDARDFLVEYRTGGSAEKPLESSFVHVLEGYREGEASAISSVAAVNATSDTGPARQIVALRLHMAAGHSDTVIYQSQPGTVTLPDGIRTDARYALVRRNAQGEVIAADAVRCTFLTCAGFRAVLPGDFTGTIVDVIGDLTGTRRESALIIKPDQAWPAGVNLQDRQLNIRVESDLRAPCDEGYRIAQTELLADGLVRVELQDSAPFVVSWHQVTELPADKPNVIRTWRPMVDHGNGPWYGGLKLWFPERDQTYTLRKVNEVGGGYGGDTAELVENVNLAAAGIKPGDWYVIYAVRPGLRVSVANDFAWRREAAPVVQRYSLRATGTVTVETPALRGAHFRRVGDGEWQVVAAGQTAFAISATGSQVTDVLSAKPDELELNDRTPPALTRLQLDGQDIAPDKAKDLGWIAAPNLALFEFHDAENALDPEPAVVLNGVRLAAGVEGPVRVQPVPEHGLIVSVDLATVWQAEPNQSRRHRLDVTVTDRSLDRLTTGVQLSFMNKAPLEPEAIYLSGLKATRSFGHAGLIVDRNYLGDVAQIKDRIYPKCVMICPEPGPQGGAYGEAVYELPPGPFTFLAEVGIETAAATNGSALFVVQTAASVDGPWATRFTSPVMRGGTEAAAVKVDLAAAKFLRLYTTDAGDGINSDHALWGNARLRRTP